MHFVGYMCHVLSKVLMWCHWSRSQKKEIFFNLCSRVGNSSERLDQPSCCGCPVSHLAGGQVLHISQPPALTAALSGPDCRVLRCCLASLNWFHLSVDGWLHTKASFLFYAHSCEFKLMYSAVSGGSSCIASSSFLQAEQTQEKNCIELFINNELIPCPTVGFGRHLGKCTEMRQTWFFFQESFPSIWWLTNFKQNLCNQ